MPRETSRLDGVVWVSPPAVTRSPSPSTSLWVPTKGLSSNAIVRSPKCMANPGPFSAHYLLPHRCLTCGFPQVRIADCDRPINSKDSAQTSIYESL